MSRTFVADIQPQSQVDEVYRIADRQLRANRQGNLYLLLQLQDRSGTISGLRWNADERLAEKFNKGTFLRVQGTSQLHNGTLQLIINFMQTVDESEVDEADFEYGSRVDADTLWKVLGEHLSKVQDDTLSKIAFAFYDDPVVQAAMRIAPAGIKAHHAYPGGLLEHVVSLVRLASHLSEHYGDLDRDVMITGAFLHDIGKLEEMAFDGELTYTDPGQLLGHLVQGVTMIDTKIHAIQSNGFQVDPNKVLHLKHIIVSHHGCHEHGSPKVPMTLESLAFHYIDELDAKLSTIRGMIDSDRSKDRWTPYNPTIARKVFKPVK